MKRHILTVLLALTFSPSLFAQNEEQASLIAQSPDGKNVKLIWFFKSWRKEITGFDIKRREGNGEWKQLNKTTILPEISTKKDISIVETDIAETNRIKTKMQQLLAAKKLMEVDNNSYLQKLNSDPKAIQDVAYMTALDYDIALMNGFAFIDRTAFKKAAYEYGLFITGTDKILVTCKWEFGTKPDLNVVLDIRAKSIAQKGKLPIIWTANHDKMQTAWVAGFNIYRDGKKLNKSVVMAASNKEMSEFTWYDSVAKSNNIIQYSINAVTLFGIEGVAKQYSYNPNDYPDEYKYAEVDSVYSEGVNFQNGIHINWSFPKEYERHLKGFYLEKDNMPEGFKQVSQLIPAGTRSYIDKTASTVASYIRFRVVAVYNDKVDLPGPENLFFYFPIIKPAKPQNLKVKIVTDSGKNYVELAWDEKLAGDTLTDYYQVYASDPVNNKFYLEAGLDPIKTNHYRYRIQHGKSYNYKFCVSAISKYKTESALSDTAKAIVPSKYLPYPVISKVALDSTKVILQWAYPEMPDLKGFRIFQNGNMVASEYELSKASKQFMTPALKQGASYNFTLQAVTESGIASDVSIPAAITIMAINKE